MLTNLNRLLATGLLVLFTVLATPLHAEPMAPFEVSIENIAAARIGDNIELKVKYLSGSETFGKFKLIVAFDPTKLTFQEVLPGAVPTVCEWDSFGSVLNPCVGCSWQTLEISGLADDPNVPGAPECMSPVGDLARIRFHITPDTLIAGSHVEVNFYWIDCSSNTLNSTAQDTTWHGRFAYDYQANEITGTDPNFGGTISGCVVPGSTVPIRAINTQNGGVQLNANWGRYGDINGDGKFNIADLAYFINYLFAGGSAPKDYLHGNYDGDNIVSIGDAVFLMNYLFFLTMGE